MAQERWRLNDASFVSGSPVLADGSNWRLTPVGANGTRSTSSWEGAACFQLQTTGGLQLLTTANGHPSAGVYWLDFMVFIPTGFATTVTVAGCLNDTATEYSWVDLQASGGNYQARVRSYDPVNGYVTQANWVTAGPINNWCRVRVLTSAKGVGYAELWTGADLPQPDGTNENATPTATTTPTWSGGSFSSWQQIKLLWDNVTDVATVRIDDVLFNNFSAPTRQPPNVQAALSETATLTAAGTATRTIAAAPSATATMTALGGLVVPAQATASSTASLSADAAVITTHNAEAYLTTTAATSIGTALTRSMNAALTSFAVLNATAATNTAAELVAAAAMTAKVRIEGETTPGQLRSRVITTTITS